MANTTTTSAKKKYTYAVGRRKSAVVTLKLFSGKQQSEVNGRPLETYFQEKNAPLVYKKPFVVTDTLSKYYFSAKAVGGGIASQTVALSLAISRALVKVDEAFRQTLRANDLLTVDSRVRERRMVGTGGKSRRKKQSPRR